MLLTLLPVTENRGIDKPHTAIYRSDEQGTSYGRFSAFLCPLDCLEEKFKCLGGFLGAFRSDFRCEYIEMLFCYLNTELCINDGL